MKNFLILVFLLGSLTLFSQKEIVKISAKKEYTTSSGLKFVFYKYNKKAESIDSGDVVSINYVGNLSDGTLFRRSSDRKRPFSFEVEKPDVIKGLHEAIIYMHVGDSAKVTIPANLAYGDKQYGSIPANSALIFNIKVVKVEKANKPFNVVGLDTIVDPSGLKYMVVMKGKGNPVQTAQKAHVHYTGYFMDGKIFDSSKGHPGAIPFSFMIDRNQVIRGWEIGIKGMRKGEKRRLVIPYELAYGEAGSPPSIPGKTNLVFDVELVDWEIVPVAIPYDAKGKDTITTESGLKYVLVKDNKGGRQIVDGDTVSVVYTGFLTDGKIFDSSFERNDSITLLVGRGQVIKGWDEGLQKLKEGDKARIIIPYALAYGENGRPPIIPAKSDLIFDVHIKKVGKQ